MQWIDTRELGFKLYCLRLAGGNFLLADPIDTDKADPTLLNQTGFKIHKGTGRYYAPLDTPIIKALRSNPKTRDITVDKSQIIITQNPMEDPHEQDYHSSARPDPNPAVRQDGTPAPTGKLSKGAQRDDPAEDHHRVSQRDPDADHCTGADPDPGAAAGIPENQPQNELPAEDQRVQLQHEDSRRRDPAGYGHDSDPGSANVNPDHFFIGRQITRESGFRAKDRYQENIEAIRILKKLEQQGKQASNYQKGKLVKYNGWGGLPIVFENYPTTPWAIEAKEELPNLLTDEEFEAARASVTNAHYTPPVTIKQIWKGLVKMGFEGGNIIDPALGVGNFFGFAPKKIVENSNLYAVEQDPIPGRLAQQIYPDARIFVQGYEKTSLPDNFFDLAITNVPFGNYSVYDTDYPGLSKHSIHDYYFLKSLEKVKPDGVVAFITSAYTMDKKNASVRRKIHEKANFLGAIRLPVNAQLAQAGTSVTTDIILLQKRSAPLAAGETGKAQWLASNKVKLPSKTGYMTYERQVNQYFLDHPEQVAGELVVDTGEGGRPRVSVPECTPEELQNRLSKIFDRMARTIDISPKEKSFPIIEIEPVSNITLESSKYPNANFGSYFYEDDTVVQIVGKTEDGWEAKDCGLAGRTRDRMIGLIRVKEALRRVLSLEKSTPADDPDEFQVKTLDQARQELNEKYDAFVEAFGFINMPVNCRLFNDDPEIGLVMSVENFDSEEKTATKADILKERVIFDRPAVTRVDTVQDGFLACLDQLGRVDIAHIAKLANVSRIKAIRDLEEQDSIFFDPEVNQWQTAPEYLSGNVRKKLRTAIAANDLEKGRYKRNVEALRKVQPVDLKPSEIFVRFGAPWIPIDTIRDFMIEKMQIPANWQDDIRIEYREIDGHWVMDAPWHCDTSNLATQEYGTKRRSFFDILERSMNRKKVSVYDTIQVDRNNTRREINYKETLVAEQKLDKIQREFNRFIWQDAKRGKELLKIYNETLNNYIPPKYDGSHLTFPGMSNYLTPRPCQKDAVWRGLMTGNILLAHEVGVGKTLELVCLAMEMNRLGKANKPTIIIPNHMLEQITREAQQLYPSAKILMVTQKDLDKHNRKVFMGKIANNNWDLTVITHNQFKKLRLDPEFERRLLMDERADFRAALSEMSASDNKPRYSVKRIEAAVKKYTERIEELDHQIDEQQDPGLLISDTGIDAFLVDESHNYKNLDLVNPGSEVESGISGSQQARDMHQKITWLYDKRGSESGVAFASGTPVTNNLFELYNVQRYLQPSVLKESGVHHVNAWAASFLSPKSQWEPKPSGDGWTLRTRYELVNIPELMERVRTTMDVVRANDIGLKRPEVETINVTVHMSAAQSAYMNHLASRVEAMKAGIVTDSSEDNLLKVVSEGRQLSLDPKLIEHLFRKAGMALEDFELDDAEHQDKVDEMVDNIIEIYHETHAQKGVQLVFCDMGTPSAKKQKYTVYDRIKQQLVAAGLPADEIAFIHEYKTDKAKGVAFKKVREGQIRVFLGSTRKMGEGSNMQDRIAAMHDLDAPWRPSDIDQRGGRMQRQGNMFDFVKRFIYTTQDSFDLFMWNVLKVKAEQFVCILKGDKSIRRLDMVVDPTYAETTAITTGNPLIREKLEIDQRVAELEALESAHRDTLWDIHNAKERLRNNIKVYEAELESSKQIPKASSLEVEAFTSWQMDLKSHGYDKDFEGDRKALVKHVAKVFKKTGLNTLAGITCAGIPLQVDRFLDKKTQKHQSFWTVQDESGHPTDIEFSNVRMAESGLYDREARLLKIPGRIATAKQELAELESERPEEFEFADELEDTKSLQMEIEARIQELENPSEDEDQQEAESSAPCVA